jgi:prepilin-type N-terminal cleavage/methylation domain-containing protein
MTMRNHDQGYTLVEILAVIAIVGILIGAALVMVTNGLGYATYAHRWFNSQTKMTRVMHQIAFGSGSLPGIAGAADVEVLNGGKGLRIYFGAAEQVSYTWDDVNNVLRLSTSPEPLLDNVTLFEVTAPTDGIMVEFTIEVTLPPPRNRILSSTQQVLVRNKVVTDP